MNDSEVDVIELDCKYVAATEQGDGFQILFEKEPPDPDSDDEYNCEHVVPYFLIQRHLEPPGDGEFYVETENPETCGHCSIGVSSLSRNCFQVDVRWTKKLASRFRIRFRADQETFEEVKRVLSTMLGKGKLQLIWSGA